MSRDEQFAEFVSARYRSLMRTAMLLAGDAGHAEDLVQSALVKTYLAWARLRAPENANGYATKALVRLAVRARQRRWQGEIPAAQAGLNIAAAARPLELAIDVRRALAELPAGQRAVLVHRYLDDRSEAETAQLLGISPGTVKSRASRGLAGQARTTAPPEPWRPWVRSRQRRIRLPDHGAGSAPRQRFSTPRSRTAGNCSRSARRVCCSPSGADAADAADGTDG